VDFETQNLRAMISVTRSKYLINFTLGLEQHFSTM